MASQALQTKWQSLPLPTGCADVVVGDGSLNALPSLTDYRPVLAEAARVLKWGGRLVLRCFVSPDEPEPLEEIVGDAMAGRIGSMHAFKWRLAMALTGDDGIPVTTIHAAFQRLLPDRAALAGWTGWPRDSIDTIDAYQDVGTRYTFPTLGSVSAFAQPYLRMVAVRYGDYELAERCPTIALVADTCARS